MLRSRVFCGKRARYSPEKSAFDEAESALHQAQIAALTIELLRCAFICQIFMLVPTQLIRHFTSFHLWDMILIVPTTNHSHSFSKSVLIHAGCFSCAG